MGGPFLIGVLCVLTLHVSDVIEHCFGTVFALLISFQD